MDQGTVRGHGLEQEALSQTPWALGEDRACAAEPGDQCGRREGLDDEDELGGEAEDVAVDVRAGAGVAPHVPDHVITVALAHAAISWRSW
ncbi:hypothetical protein [Streptomyces hydrogenans]|uniref:hypothetical protein n=1 Tax=Streptomyces hydrogenans TaxID=1873719 RepID=UPI003322F784